MSSWLDLDEAVKLIMEQSGCSRRSAKRQLLRALASGKVRSSGSFDGAPREALPKEFWRGQFTDNEGDEFDTERTEH